MKLLLITLFTLFTCLFLVDANQYREIVIPSKNFELYHKLYSFLSENGKINESKDLFQKLIRQSKTEPQPIVEISKTAGSDSIKESTLGRLWLYNEKIYEFDRNDYDQRQVKLLILDFLDKEKEKFARLKRKCESKKI